MAIHILGNGPSIRLFDRDAWPETDVFAGCNFSDTSLRPNYTVIVDVQAMKKFRGGTKKGYRLEIPAVVTQRAYDYIDKDTGGWETMAPDLIRIIDVIPLERDRKISRKLAMNSGQHATVYSIRTYNDHASSVHIWGTDSFWSDDLESTTDAIVRPEQQGRRIKPQVTLQWNGYWQKIFRDHPNTEFIIHAPSNVTRIVDGVEDYTNVRIERES